jgi:hypothetical protein
MVEQVGKNAVSLGTAGTNAADIAARIAATEAQGLKGIFNAPPAAGTDSVPFPPAPIDAAQMQVAPPLMPSPKEPEIKVDGPQKFKEPDGTLNLDKIEKSNEHLQRGIESRAEKLLALNRELQKKFTQTGQELSEKSKLTLDDDALEFTEEGKRKILKDLEENPIETILKVARTAAKRETGSLMSDVAAMKEQTRESRELHELDDLVKDGNEWILSEGLSRFETTFQERPYLRQSKTPFRDALRFMDFPRPNGQPTQARVGSLTPILGASQTVPPPNALPPSTPERDIENLSAELRNAVAERDFKKARELEAQMDRVYKGMYRR